MKITVHFAQRAKELGVEEPGVATINVNQWEE